MTDDITKAFLDKCTEARESCTKINSPDGVPHYTVPTISKIDAEQIMADGGGSPGTASAAAGLALSAIT